MEVGEQKWGETGWNWEGFFLRIVDGGLVQFRFPARRALGYEYPFNPADSKAAADFIVI